MVAEDLTTEVVDLLPGDIVDHQKLWEIKKEWLSKETPERFPIPEFDNLPQDIRRLPLALSLYASVQKAQSQEKERDNGSLRSKSQTELITEARTWLSPEARKVLDIISVYGQPLSRGNLREIWAQSDDPETLSARLDELYSWGLIYSNKDFDQRIRLHPAIRKVGERRARAEDPKVWGNHHRAIARQYLTNAAKTNSIWSLFWGYFHLQCCGETKEAYEVQKTFIESLLSQGYLDLSRAILEELLESVESPYREVIMGNLAIIYKSEGRHEGRHQALP